jgi:hypothetical protein
MNNFKDLRELPDYIKKHYWKPPLPINNRHPTQPIHDVWYNRPTQPIFNPFNQKPYQYTTPIPPYYNS